MVLYFFLFHHSLSFHSILSRAGYNHIYPHRMLAKVKKKEEKDKKRTEKMTNIINFGLVK